MLLSHFSVVAFSERLLLRTEVELDSTVNREFVMGPELTGSPPDTIPHPLYDRASERDLVQWIWWAYAAAPLADCFFTTGWNFECSGIGEGLVTSLWAGLSGAMLFMLLPLTKKGAGASQAAGCLPAGGGPGLFLACWLQSDTSSLVGIPVHQGSLGHPRAAAFLEACHRWRE